MHRTTAAGVLPGGLRTAGDPLTGVPPTQLDPDYDNAVQEELITLLAGVGVSPQQSLTSQLRQAVRRYAGASRRSFTAGSHTLTPDDAGLVLVNASSGNVTLTLPAAAAAAEMPLRYLFARLDGTGNQVIIQAAGGEQLEFGSSIALLRDMRVEIISNGSAVWYVMGQTSRINGTPAIGYQVVESGLILQWGAGTLPASGAAASSTTITFPIQFPGAVFSAQWSGLESVNSGVGGAAIPVVGSLTTSGFVAVGDTNTGTMGSPITFNKTVPIRWTAIGI